MIQRSLFAAFLAFASLTVGTCSGPESPKHNDFLIWRGGGLNDFELRVSARVKGDNNTGIQYRSHPLPEVGPWAIGSYQCDIHPTPNRPDSRGQRGSGHSSYKPFNSPSISSNAFVRITDESFSNFEVPIHVSYPPRSCWCGGGR